MFFQEKQQTSICISPEKAQKDTTRWVVSFFCLWATKKIFSAVLRMNSNSCKNEILADARMKSAKADEIFGFASDEIKSTHPPSRRISSNEVGFHRRRRFQPPARVDLVEKSTDKVDAFFWWRQQDSTCIFAREWAKINVATCVCTGGRQCPPDTAI